ncbi:MAG: LysR substrate-binding domain-containing protein [Alteromonadaceae bacterium]|jgi:LysR family glycine cleavage system transcriptional activator
MDQRLKYLNALRTFESAARHKSYTIAAKELFVSQAAVSQQVRQLEQVLSVKLFIRSGRKMLLTESGDSLFASTHQALSLLVKGLNSIQNEDVAGDLTITSTQAFCSLWLMPRLFRFSQLYPDVNVRILGSNQKEDLHKKQIDLGIRFGVKNSVSGSENLVMEDFGEDVVYPICSPKLLQHTWLKSPKDILDCTLVSVENERLVTWESWFEHAGVEGYEKVTKKTEVTSSDMALSAVLSGHGVTLAASAIFSQYIPTKQLVVPFKIKHPMICTRYFAYDPNSVKRKRIQVFIDWVRTEMASSEPKVLLR